MTPPLTLLLKETPEQLIHRVADSLEPAIRRTFLEAVESLKRKVPVGELTELLESGRITAMFDALDDIKLTPEELAPIRDAIQDAVIRVAKPTAAEFGIAFDLVQPRAIRFATEQAGKLIVQIDSETRQAVADIVSRGLREGVAPRQQALLIREIVGLTQRDAGAVDRFLQGALESGMRGPQARAQAERMARRLLARRAENIARTETIRASNMGTQLAWESAQDAGLLPPGTQKVWIATEDSRLCPICAVLDGQVIDLGGSFDVQEEATAFTIDGQEIRVTATRPLRKPSTTKTPPAHPSCRCTTGIELVETVTAPGEWKPMMTEQEAKEFTIGSQYEKTVYHGTKGTSAKGITAEGFDPTLIEKGHFFGDGTYFTPRFGAADNWAWNMDALHPTVLSSKVRLKKAFVMEDWPTMPFDIDDHLLASRPNPLGIITDSPNIKPFINDWLDANPDIAGVMRRTAERTDITGSNTFTKRLSTTLQEMGYDGAVMRTTDRSSPWGSVLVGGEEVMVFDPTNIATFKSIDLGFA